MLLDKSVFFYYNVVIIKKEAEYYGNFRSFVSKPCIHVYDAVLQPPFPALKLKHN